MSGLTPPVQFSDFRKAIVAIVEQVTGLKCIRLQPSTPDAPRPPLPYFGYKITTPGKARGEPSFQSFSASNFNYGQQMEMIVSFQCYAKDQDDAYSYMVLWQNALNLANVLEDLRRKGLAVWDFSDVADLSELLNTGYEGRAHLDVNFGYASNLGADLGEIAEAQIQGQGEVSEIDMDIIKP